MYGGVRFMNVDPNKLYLVDFVAKRLSVAKKMMLWWIRAS